MAKILVLTFLALAPAAVECWGFTQKSGGCSATDIGYIHSHPGYGAHSFGQTANTCGHQAYNIFRGLSVSDFQKCLKQKTEFSDTCVDCFGQSADYGAHNCKWACISSWCSQSCQTCASVYLPTLTACTGFQLPAMEPCDSEAQEEVKVAGLSRGCLAAVQDYIHTHAGKSSDSLGSVASTCGHKAYSLFWSGFKRSTFEKWVSSPTGISGICACLVAAASIVAAAISIRRQRSASAFEVLVDEEILDPSRVVVSPSPVPDDATLDQKEHRVFSCEETSIHPASANGYQLVNGDTISRENTLGSSACTVDVASGAFKFEETPDEEKTKRSFKDIRGAKTQDYKRANADSHNAPEVVRHLDRFSIMERGEAPMEKESPTAKENTTQLVVSEVHSNIEGCTEILVE